MKIETVKISPQVAINWLENNTRNRAIKKAVVSRYAAEMKAGNWIAETGETIKISAEGKLLDGQHRLSAVILAGSTVEMQVATGCNDDIFKVIDTGAKRLGADVLSIEGAKNHAVLAAVLSRYLAYKKGNTGRFKDGLSNTQILKTYQENPQLWEALIQNVVRWRRLFNGLLPAAVIGVWYTVFYKIDCDKAFEFFEQFCTGDAITNPTINVLRNQIIKDKLAVHKMPEVKRDAFIIKAWNCFRKGTTLSILKFDPISEQIPKAI